MRNAESKIRTLINAPGLQVYPMPELIPIQIPPEDQFPANPENYISEALTNRPEMRMLAAQLRAADVRTQQARNETLPSLDIVMETYVSGLEGNSKVGQAFVEQFSQGAPSYGVGLEFSTPLGNRAAHSRLQQRLLDKARILHVMEDQADRIRTEVEIAARNVETAYQTILARSASLKAVRAELEYLTERWRRLRGGPQSWPPPTRRLAKCAGSAGWKKSSHWSPRGPRTASHGSNFNGPLAPW